MLRPVVLGLTFVTGFTGLAYEVTWQKYLAVLLGAHSEATAAVLGLFLGGLSIGYWLFGGVTRRLVARGRAQGRPAPLLVVYGAVEASIGLYALCFPLVFGAVRAVSVMLPTGVGAFGFAVDVGLAAVVVLPPAIAMGGTIPILTQALARDLADATRLHAYVYAFNTAGAFAGALASGFVLIEWLGLQGVMGTMGAVNLAVGALLAALGRRRRELARLESDAPPPAVATAGALPAYGLVALLVGFAMMVFQTAIIRVGGLSFGSSEYTFSMVVAVFVLCIALGSAGVSLLPRIGRALLPGLLWGLAALFGALYLALETGPYWAHVLRTFFRDTSASFPVFWVAAFALVLAAIGPAVALAGATLPLLFHSLKNEVGDLGVRAGRLYSLNTVGSLLGALLGGYALLFWLDLHHVFRIGVGVLALAAAIVTFLHYPGVRRAGAAALLVAFAVGLVALPEWQPQRMSSGLFRKRAPDALSYGGPGAVPAQQRFSFYDDDPNTTVAVEDFGNPEDGDLTRSIVVNGKSDGNTLGDYGTVAMLSLVPAMLAERVEHAFVIGFGTGISVGELAVLDEVESVTVAEISPGVVEAAPLFDFANHGVSTHPKVEIVRSDAYRALLKGRRSYDLIVSEPSNPWVTGTEMLFSKEFLEEARDRLSPRGVYSQWLHTYETSDESVELVLRTYASVFERVAVWAVHETDLILLGFRDPDAALDVERIVRRMFQPDISRGLTRLGIAGPAGLLVHEELPQGVVNAAALDGPVHSLFRPRLSFVAGRGFFVGAQAQLPFLASGEPLRVGQANSLLKRRFAGFDGGPPEAAVERVFVRACANALSTCESRLAEWRRAHPNERLPETVRALPELRVRLRAASRANQLLAGPRAGRFTLEEALDWTSLYLSVSTPIAPLDPDALVRVWQRCGAQPAAAGFCGRGLALAERLARGEAVPGYRGWEQHVAAGADGPAR